MRQWLPWVGLIWAGCPTSFLPTTNDTAPTDPPTDTGSGTTDTSPPPDATPETPMQITFNVTGEWANLGLTLTELGAPNATDYALLEIGEVLASTTVTSATPSLTLDPIAAEDLQPHPAFPTIQWAVYAVALHEDGDSDGEHDPEERYAAVSNAALVFVRSSEPLPTTLTSLGMQLGWNALTVVDQPLASVPLNAVPIEIHPEENQLTLSGIFDPYGGYYTGTYPTSTPTTTPTTGTGDTGDKPPLPTGDTGDYYFPTGADSLAAIPAPMIYRQVVPKTLLYDAELEKTWSMTLTGEPPSDHQFTSDPFLPDGFALEYPLWYIDVNEDSAFTDEDFTLAAPCEPEAQLTVRALWATRTPDLGLTIALEGRTGWLAILNEPPYYGYKPYTSYGSYSTSTSKTGTKKTGTKKSKGKTSSGTGYPYYNAEPASLEFPEVRVGTLAKLEFSFACYY